jgi:hypothetical protein
MNPSRHRASALLITLAFLTLIVMLVVSLVETVRIGNASASANLEGVRAELCAGQGIERVLGTLRAVTVPASGSTTTNYWVSQPGALWTATTTGVLPSTIVDLSSGSASSAIINSSTSYLRPANLNCASLRASTNYLVTGCQVADGSTVAMQLKWIYIRRSGTLDFSETPVTSNKTDPVVGRYAYWTDDESSKVNYNLAWVRTSSNANPLNNPTRINLASLPGLSASLAESIRSDISTATNYTSLLHGFYNGPDDGARVSTDVAVALNSNRFDVTHYNSDPNTGFRAQLPIVLTTDINRVPKKADGSTPAQPYINILTTAGTDPGISGNLDAVKVNAAITNIITQLQRTDWPMVNGSSFEKKYYSGNTARLAQLAINIIDYVRYKESTNAMVAPLRIQYTGGTYTMSQSNGTNCFLGTGREPCITEVGVWCSPTPLPEKTNFITKFKVEVYLPKNYGVSSVNLNKYNLYTAVWYYGAGSTNVDESIGTGSLTSITTGSSTLTAGSYAVITRTMTNYSTVANVPPTTLSARFSLNDTQTAGGRCVVVPQISSYTASIPLTVDSTHAENDIVTMEVGDPRMGQHKDDWKTCSSGNNTLGQQNSAWSVGTAASSSITPQQDTDASGNISDAGLYMPPPKGKIYNNYDNTAGMVTSVAELGYISTGIESVTAAGVPWRTFRFQPNKQSASVVPDWALFDIFTAPMNASTAATNIYFPHGTSVAGRVNVNAQFAPFASTFPLRVSPLAAALAGCATNTADLTATMSTTQAQTVAQSISSHTLASNGKSYGADSYYLSPGQIAEIKGVADGGEASEELLRQAGGLLTARGNVFTIYSIGQALKQTPTGLLVVTGERRLQSMVERYTDLSTGNVHFRTIYFRVLTP